MLASTLAVTPCVFAEPAAANNQTQTQNQVQTQTQEAVAVDTSQLYEIRSGVGNNQVLDIAGGSPVNEANLQIHAANGSNAQRFRFVKNNDDTYTIMTMAGSRALDVRGGSSKRGTNVRQYNPNGTKAQKWKLTKNADGTVTIQPANSEKCALDVNGGRGRNGANVQIYTGNGSAAQKWTLVSKGAIPDYSANNVMLNPSYTSNTVLDVSGGSIFSCANIQCYQYNDSAAQLFNLKRQSDGSYMIQNAKNGKVLDVAGGSKRKGANVWQYSVNNSDAQKWIVTKSGDTYTFRNRGSGMVLDVSGGSRNSGANVQVYTYNNSAAQKWRVVTKNRAVTNSANLGSTFTALVKNANSKVLTVSGSNVVMQSASWLTTKGWTFVRNLDHSYTLIPLSNKSKALDISGGRNADGANVQIYNQNNSRAQKFVVVSKGKGQYTLMPENSTTRVIDVAGNSSKENANVDLYTANNSKAQLFTIQKANASQFKTPTPPETTRQRIVKVAQKEVGYHEYGNNGTKYGAWAHCNYQPWCATFVSWCGAKAGASSKVFCYHNYTGNGVQWYQGRGRWRWKGYAPKSGDLVYIGKRMATHVEIVEKRSGNTMTTIDGNWSDKVKRVNRNIKASDIFGYATPAY